MTTKEEYSEAADKVQEFANVVSDLPCSDSELSAEYDKQWTALDLAARVLRQLADGAVLCREGQTTYIGYSPIEEQP